MKKQYIASFIYTMVFFLFVGCLNINNHPNKTENVPTATSTQEETTEYLNPLLNPDNYKDIDIKKSLPDKSEIVLEDFSNSLAQTKYRYCYYRLGEVRDMFSQEEVDKFETQWDKEHPNSKPIETCMIVDFVQYFNIKKEDFEMAIKKWIYWSQWAKVSIENEEYEIPNPDIIYTFDDDIINEYYRRK